MHPVEWQKDSAYLPLAVAWDMRGSREGDTRYYNLVGGLTWTLHNCWSQYRYSMDDAMLREKIYPLLRRSINLYLHIGLWACGGSPCIESTLGMANIVQDMLIQSWSDPAKDEPGLIRIFPALPSAWKEVEFHDLRAEGAFLVSAKRTAGETDWVRIKSLVGGLCRVRPGLGTKVRLQSDHRLNFKQVSPEIYEMDMKKNDEALLL